jgi:HK97 family phage major capsid protein
MADIIVKDNNVLFQIKDLVEAQGDEIQSTLTKLDEVEQRSGKLSTEQEDMRKVLKDQQDLLENVNTRLDKLDQELPKGNKGYRSADGTPEERKSAARRKVGEMLADITLMARNQPERYGFQTYFRTQSEGTNADGGYLVPEEQANEIITLVSNFGFARKYCRIIPMTREVMRIPTSDYGPTTLIDGGAAGTGQIVNTALATGEGQTAAQSVTHFSRPQLQATRLMALDTLSIEVTEDSTPSLMNFLVDVFAEAVALAEDNQVLSASAAPFTGVLFESGVGVATMGSGSVSFKHIKYTDLIDTYNAADEKAQDSGIWVMSAYTWNQIRKALVDSQGYPFINPAQPVSAPVPMVLWGRPVVLSTKMPKSSQDDGTANRAFIAYGDFSRYALFGDRTKLAVDVSPHAAFTTGQLVMRVMERFAFKIVQSSVFSRLRTGS